MEYHFWDGSDVTDKNESTNADKRSLKADMLFSYDNDGDGIKNVEKVTMAGDDLRYAAIRSGAGGDENDISIRYRDLRTGEIRNDVIEADGDTQVIYVNSSTPATLSALRATATTTRLTATATATTMSTPPTFWATTARSTSS